jgi:hypothetical protein
MISASEPRSDRALPDDIIDVALEISWIVSEIAVDVFGMFFWSALVLLFMQGAA